MSNKLTQFITWRLRTTIREAWETSFEQFLKERPAQAARFMDAALSAFAVSPDAAEIYAKLDRSEREIVLLSCAAWIRKAELDQRYTQDDRMTLK